MVKMGKESAILMILNLLLNQFKYEFPVKNKNQYMKKEYSKQKELEVPKSKSTNRPDVFLEQQGGQCGWSRDSDKNSVKKLG